MKQEIVNFLNLIKKKNTGFTLIELMLYIGIVSIFIVIVFQFVFMFIDARTKNQTISEVENQGAQALNQITQIIRNSQDINSPAKGSSATSLSLDVLDPAKDPTIIELVSGILRIKEGSGDYINLTNDYITVSNLSFQNVSKNKNKGIIKINFTINFNNPDNLNQFDYEKIFFGGAEIKY